jgi:hypothetical protein
MAVRDGGSARKPGAGLITESDVDLGGLRPDRRFFAVTQQVAGSPSAPRSTIPAYSWELTQHPEPWHRGNAFGLQCGAGMGECRFPVGATLSLLMEAGAGRLRSRWLSPVWPLVSLVRVPPWCSRSTQGGSGGHGSQLAGTLGLQRAAGTDESRRGRSSRFGSHPVPRRALWCEGRSREVGAAPFKRAERRFAQ